MLARVECEYLWKLTLDNFDNKVIKRCQKKIILYNTKLLYKEQKLEKQETKVTMSLIFTLTLRLYQELMSRPKGGEGAYNLRISVW